MNPTLTKIHTARFGEIDFEETDRIVFPKGIVGFPNFHSFLILNVNESSSFRWLQSIDDPSFAMLITSPEKHLTDYAPQLAKCDCDSIQLEPNVPAMIFVTATIPKGKPMDLTLNLAGPIIIHPLTRIAIQVILNEDSYTSKHRVFPENEGTQLNAA